MVSAAVGVKLLKQRRKITGESLLVTRKYLYNYYQTPKSNVYTYHIDIQHVTHERVESFLVFNCKKD